MFELSKKQIEMGRREALAAGSDLIHALTCMECDLREEFLFVLSTLGWSEDEFLTDYFDLLLRSDRGRR
jgi:hypothetical protein